MADYCFPGGCNCVACMVLDLQEFDGDREIEWGQALVNNDGRLSLLRNGHFFCFDRHVCEPNVVQCEACQNLDRNRRNYLTLVPDW